MKKFLSTLLIISAPIITLAAPGDTTTITSHNLQRLTWYENYDSVATFPDGSLSYRAIFAEFELGKYMCDGYDPSNAGEGAGETGWCADWDYDVHLIAMNAAGDTIELGELITPYANSNFPLFPWSWKHKYTFDVTDYYQVLKDVVTIRIFYAGWSGGFTATVKFHFIEGPRHRDVLAHHKLYHGNYIYGVATDPIEDRVAARDINIPTGTQLSTFNTIISGHGNINEGCSEFCNKWMKFMLNGSEVATRQIWRNDCGSNWLSPQSGTWIYNRANWCPGNKVEPIKVKLNSLVSGPHTVDINFQPFTASEYGAFYKMYTDVLHYGNYSHANNAGIEKIIIPTDDIEQRKVNPACANPKLQIKNYGSSPITSLKIEYGTTSANIYNYTGTIGIDEHAFIELPDLSTMITATGSANNFYAKIIEVNGAADTELFNNYKSSQFTSADKIPSRKVIVELKTSGNFSGSFNTVRWKIYNQDDELVKERVGSVSNNTYRDSFELADGCYRLVTETPRGMGLSFFSAYSPKGWVKLFNGTTGTQIPMYDNDLGNPGLMGNFGTGFTHYFSVADPTSIDNFGSNYLVSIYPNPANDVINIKLFRQNNKKSINITVSDGIGRTITTLNTQEDNVLMNTNNWSEGIYYIQLSDGNKAKSEKIVIKR